MKQYRILHTTTYLYSEVVSLCQNVAHIKPRPHPAQFCTRSRLMIEPNPAVLEERLDFFGNPTNYFTVQEPHRELKIVVDHEVSLLPRREPPAPGPAWETIRDQLPREADWLDDYQFTFESRYCPVGPRYAAYAAPSFPPGRPILEAAQDFMARLHQEFVYDPRATTVATPIEEVFTNRRGVCQDFAHLMIACLRSLGLATRYVSGYLSTVPPPGRPRLIGADATHAWVSLFTGANGWIDLDPTNNQIPTDRHILLAWGRDYEDVSPVKGVILGGSQHAVTVSVDVQPVGPEAQETGDLS